MTPSQTIALAAKVDFTKEMQRRTEKIKLTNSQMNLMLVAVEHGFQQCEKGNNLEAAFMSVYDLYEVER